MQIEGPERPRTALVRTDGVHSTTAATIFFARQKDTVFGRAVLFDTVFDPDTFEVFFLRLFDGYAQIFRKKFDLFFDDPDIAFFGSGTAVAATDTLKMKSTLIPFTICLQLSVLRILF